MSLTREYKRLSTVCNDAQRKKCASECGQFLEEQCKRCERNPKNIPPPSLWFLHIRWLYRLRRAGYPFQPDDLSMDEWLGMGEYAELAEARF